MNTDEPKRKFQGVWIPAAIWLDTTLSITEKVMLVEINSLEDSERGCFAGNEYFSKFFDLSKSRVSEIISSLAAKDLVRVEQIRKGKQIVERQIWMTETGSLLTGTPSENTKNPLRKTRRTPSENTKNPFGKHEEPSSEKAKENNTGTNNTGSNTDIDSPDESGVPENPSSPDLLADVDKQVISDFQAIRKAKKSPLTETALKGIKREADKLGYTMEDALTICCERGWIGFKADWILREQAEAKAADKSSPKALNSREQEKREATERAKARLFGTQKEKDITHEATRL